MRYACIRHMGFAGKIVSAKNMAAFLAREGRVLHVLQNSSHPAFPPLLASVDMISTTSTPAQPDANLLGGVLVFPELGQDLHSFIRARGRLPEWEAKVLFRQIVAGVAHCHSHCIVLRDLKLGKLFLAHPDRFERLFCASFCSLSSSHVHGFK